MTTRRSVLGQLGNNQDVVRGGSNRKSVGGSKRRSTVGGRKSLTTATGAPRQSIGGRKSLAGTGPSSRRSILGGAKRQSTASRPSTASSRHSVGSRHSLGGRHSSSGRRSSIHGSSALSDPRPLSERKYKRQCIDLLVQFLVENKYDRPVSAQNLTAPSNREFVNIFKFIYSFIDREYNWAGAKAEEEIPMLIKYVGYPFPIKASVIISCGSPHNWPKLLGALRWLIERVRYLATTDPLRVMMQTKRSIEGGNDFDQDDDEEQGDPQIDLLHYSVATYEEFLQGQVEEEDALQKLEETFGAQNEQVQTEIRELSARQEELKEELASHIGDSEALPMLTAKIKEYENDKRKFVALLDKLQQHVEVYSHRIQEATMAKKAAQADVDRLTEERQDLQRKFESQEMTQEDVQRVKQEQKDLNTAIHNVREQIEAIEEAACKQETIISRRLGRVSECLNAYNKAVSAFGLVSASRDNPAERDCRVELKPSGSTEHDLLSADIDGEIKPALSLFLEKLHRDAQNISTLKMREEEKLLRLSQQKTAKEGEIGVLKNRVMRVEDEYAQFQQASAEENQVQATAVDALQSEVSQLRFTAESMEVEWKQKAFNARTAHQELGEKLSREQEGMNQVILEAVKAVVGYKEHVAEKLAEVQEKLARA